MEAFMSISGYSPSPMSNPRPATIQNVRPGEWYTKSLEPMSFWRGRLQVTKPNTLYQMNLTFASGPPVNMAIYGRRGQPPSVTQYDWAHIVTESGQLRQIQKRSAAPSGGVSVEKSLSRGVWFIAVLNDDEDEKRTLRAVIDEGAWQKQGGRGQGGVSDVLAGRGSGCVNQCSGRGQCVKGKCRCEPQFSGEDCSKSK